QVICRRKTHSFFVTTRARPAIYALSLHDALPIWGTPRPTIHCERTGRPPVQAPRATRPTPTRTFSTRLVAACRAHRSCESARDVVRCGRVDCHSAASFFCGDVRE